VPTAEAEAGTKAKASRDGIRCRNLDWTNRTTSDLVAISLLVIFTRLNVLRSSPAPSAHR